MRNFFRDEYDFAVCYGDIHSVDIEVAVTLNNEVDFIHFVGVLCVWLSRFEVEDSAFEVRFFDESFPEGHRRY